MKGDEIEYWENRLREETPEDGKFRMIVDMMALTIISRYEAGEDIIPDFEPLRKRF